MTAPTCSHSPDHATARLGSERWLGATGGNLTLRERQSFAGPLLRAQAANTAGRLAMLLRRESGRRAAINDESVAIPDSALARQAEAAAVELLSPMLLAHSRRSYVWGAAIASLEGIAFDAELLWIAAMLHDTGLAAPTARTDFTARSLELLDERGPGERLAPQRRQVVGDAIAGHHSPGVSLADGAEAYLLSTGAGVDVFGLRSWELPPAFRTDVVRCYPRQQFKREFSSLWRDEARAVPRGRARLLRRWAAADIAIKLAPYGE